MVPDILQTAGLASPLGHFPDSRISPWLASILSASQAEGVCGNGSWVYLLASAPCWLVQGVLARPPRLPASGARAVRRRVPFPHRVAGRPLSLPPRPLSACALRPPEKLPARLALSTGAAPA